MKKLYVIVILYTICLIFCNCTPSEMLEPVSEEHIMEELSYLSQMYDIPIQNDMTTPEMSSNKLEQIESCMVSLHSLLEGEMDIYHLAPNEILIAPQVSSSPTTISKSEIKSVSVGDISWICCFTISWTNDIDVTYSAEGNCETFDDEIVCAYINHISNRVYLDANFYLSLGGIETLGRYALYGYYDLNNNTSHFSLSRV